MGKMEVTITISDKLAAEAQARGVSVEVYIQEILARQTHEATNAERLATTRAAIDRIIELRRENRLAGIQVKDLIHEGHKR
ncbi:MAG TPA: hypothetical protein VJP87_03970 [Candidatus Acidoferrales bacterium]|nr:hypothetical protein [Candidatus Acidoferrales bacterium]